MTRWFRVISITGFLLMFMIPSIEMSKKYGDTSVLIALSLSFLGATQLAHLCDLTIRYLQLKIYENWKEIKELDED